jgi:hypothetical protein
MTDPESDTWSISVVRTGGFAGLRREWRVSSADAPELDWRLLIDACPWSTVALPTPATDRFVWRIDVHGGKHERRATLGDANLVGAWRELVDRVKSTATD